MACIEPPFPHSSKLHAHTCVTDAKTVRTKVYFTDGDEWMQQHRRFFFNPLRPFWLIRGQCIRGHRRWCECARWMCSFFFFAVHLAKSKNGANKEPHHNLATLWCALRCNEAASETNTFTKCMQQLWAMGYIVFRDSARLAGYQYRRRGECSS